MSFYHSLTGTTYDQLPDGASIGEYQDIGQRPSDWHFWNAALGEWVEDVAGIAAAAARGW